MNRALRFTLLGVALVVVLFAVTWFSLPAPRTSSPSSSSSYSTYISRHVPCDEAWPPAKPFMQDRTCYQLDDVKARIAVVYGSLAVVIILVGLAFGAGRRPPAEA